MDYYKDDLDRPPRRAVRYPDDDYFDSREPYDDFERSRYPSDDPYGPGAADMYRMYPPRPGPPPGGPMEPPPPPPPPSHESYVMCGMVAVDFKNPFDPKPHRRPKPARCHTVFVGSLPDNCIDVHLRDIFRKCGEIVDTRVSRGRNFGHVQFIEEKAVDMAMDLSGCTIRIKNSYSSKDKSKIHVDYAQDKSENDFRKKSQDDEPLPYSATNAQAITSEIHGEDCFNFAAKTMIFWLTKSQLEDAAATPVYNAVTSINTHGRQLNKIIQTHDEEAFEYNMKRKVALQKLLSEAEMMVEVYDSAATGKMWSSFTKGQRKTITQWKEQAKELKERLKSKIEEEDEKQRDEPPRKIAKQASGVDANLEADLDRAEKEIEQLKTDREVAIEKKDKQILQLKTLMAKFKKTCPEEWEKALGVKKDEKANSSQTEDMLSTDVEEVIDGVSMDDLNAVIDKNASENSLASAAAAYAQMRKSVGSESSGLGLSEAEVAIVAVLAAFLTVHPLGASIDAITSYFQNFNPAYNSYYLESLLRRLSKVFQLSGEGSGKWWFMGFQTCYASPTSATENHKS